MLTIEEIKRKKEACGYTNEQLAKVSGVPLGTLQKILGNVTKSPRYETLRALSAVFEGAPVKRTTGERKVDYLEELAKRKTEPEMLMFCDSHPLPEPVNPIIAVNWNEYDRQGTYTLEDYLALPDEQRVELIDGVIYDMGSPTTPHQMIGGAIHSQIFNYIGRKKGKCIPFMAPMDVQIDCDNRTIVQPDVMIVCDRDKINRSRIFGAPDFVVEVLSPSTKNKDFFVKGKKYYEAGVKEYWMVDPMKKEILAYDFRTEDIDLKVYTFDDEVPVLLYDGDLKIDFREIREYISFLDGKE